RLQSELRVMQAIGVELDLGSGGAAAEEVHGTALANHVNCLFPSLRTADGFDDHVRSPLVRRQVANGFDRVFDFRDLDDFVRAHATRGLHLGIALHDGDYVTASGLCDLDKHQSDGSAANDGDGVADFNSGLM